LGRKPSSVSQGDMAGENREDLPSTNAPSMYQCLRPNGSVHQLAPTTTLAFLRPAEYSRAYTPSARMAARRQSSSGLNWSPPPGGASPADNASATARREASLTSSRTSSIVGSTRRHAKLGMAPPGSPPPDQLAPRPHDHPLAGSHDHLAVTRERQR